jgi:hypothetical protein
VQSLLGRHHPCWFFNFEELIDHVRGLGYEVVERWPEDERFVMSNFPSTHRVPATKGVLFKRSTPAR